MTSTPIHSSTPVRHVHRNTEDDTFIPPIAKPATVRGTPATGKQQTSSSWSEYFTPLQVGPFLPRAQGLVQALTDGTTALDAFLRIFDFALFDRMAQETNLYASQKQQSKPDPSWTPTNPEEIKAYIGIHIIMGLVNYPRYHLYWSQDDYFANYGIKNTMPRKQFQLLERYLHMNDIRKMPKSGEPDFDPLYRIRPAIDSCKFHFQQAYIPGREISATGTVRTNRKGYPRKRS